MATTAETTKMKTAHETSSINSLQKKEVDPTNNSQVDNLRIRPISVDKADVIEPVSRHLERNDPQESKVRLDRPLENERQLPARNLSSRESEIPPISPADLFIWSEGRPKVHIHGELHWKAGIEARIISIENLESKRSSERAIILEEDTSSPYSLDRGCRALFEPFSGVSEGP